MLRAANARSTTGGAAAENAAVAAGGMLHFASERAHRHDPHAAAGLARERAVLVHQPFDRAVRRGPGLYGRDCTPGRAHAALTEPDPRREDAEDADGREREWHVVRA
jgi:hypothetical protein